jgi:Cd2+/Zn2+-exporting ATPase
LGDTKPAELLRLAASAEKYSNHPTAKALARLAGEAGVPLVEPKDFSETAGRGIKAQVNGTSVLVGRAQWLLDNGVPQDFQKSVDLNETEGWSLIFVARDGKCIGWVGLQDQTRSDARQALAELKESGVRRIAMISGDRQAVATRVAAEIGCEEAQGDCLPQNKVEFVRAMKLKGYKVAVIGDGVNDAPALATATVGIAMGVSGTDVALETADVVLMADDIGRIPYAVELGRRALRVVKQNLVVALGVIILLVTADVLGRISLPTGVIGHEGSTLLVTLSGLRLLQRIRLL